MAPRFADGAVVQVEIGHGCTFVPQRGMAVLFINRQSPIPLVKTVVAQPGDRWDVAEDGRVNVNGAEALTAGGRPYRLEAAGVRMLRLYVRDYGGIIPPQTYLLLGAYEGGSLDASRFGLVHRRDVIGRVVEGR
ncbi:hypothetical protein ASD54_25335 [Rhizobium sp. Root149]|nr:hypothetical protein ASD54_25335 [Rhizobium sp. Root149]